MAKVGRPPKVDKGGLVRLPESVVNMLRRASNRRGKSILDLITEGLAIDNVIGVIDKNLALYREDSDFYTLLLILRDEMQAELEVEREVSK